MKVILIVILRIALGGLLLYGGINKFKPTPPKTKVIEHQEVSPDVQKIKAFIGGMKQTNYFWEFLGVSEIVCGLLLISQVFSLLGAVMSVPITLNIFLFHLFLEFHETNELMLTTLYLVVNLIIIVWEYPKLKTIFLPQIIKS